MASYRKRHIKNKIHKIKPKKSIFIRPWFWIVLLFLIIVLSVFYFFLFYPGIQVKNIIISGNQKIASKDIENLVSDNINNKIIKIGGWQINSESIFLANSAKIDKEILNKFPIIESIKINKKFMQTLDVRVNERVPVAVFCPLLDKISETQTGKCYFMDDNGIIFEPLYVMPQNMVIVRQSMDDAQIFTGGKVIQQNIIDLLLKVEKNMKDNFQISLKKALVASYVRLDINTDENWQIYFDLSPDSDINLQITKLNLLLSGGISADERKNLRYIDLRPQGRAIVCDNMECGSPH